jgi:hypothetical protein
VVIRDAQKYHRWSITRCTVTLGKDSEELTISEPHDAFNNRSSMLGVDYGARSGTLETKRARRNRWHIKSSYPGDDRANRG